MHKASARQRYSICVMCIIVVTVMHVSMVFIPNLDIACLIFNHFIMGKRVDIVPGKTRRGKPTFVQKVHPKSPPTREQSQPAAGPSRSSEPTSTPRKASRTPSTPWPHTYASPSRSSHSTHTPRKAPRTPSTPRPHVYGSPAMDIHASPVGMSPHMPKIKSTGKKSASGKVINRYVKYQVL